MGRSCAEATNAAESRCVSAEAWTGASARLRLPAAALLARPLFAANVRPLPRPAAALACRGPAVLVAGCAAFFTGCVAPAAHSDAAIDPRAITPDTHALALGDTQNPPALLTLRPACQNSFNRPPAPRTTQDNLSSFRRFANLPLRLLSWALRYSKTCP